MTTPLATALEREIVNYTVDNPKSAELHEKATHFMPGSDTRNSIYWDPFPLYITDGTGTTLTDANDNSGMGSYHSTDMSVELSTTNETKWWQLAANA
jgi:hypothetical protein